MPTPCVRRNYIRVFICLQQFLYNFFIKFHAFLFIDIDKYKFYNDAIIIRKEALMKRVIIIVMDSAGIGELPDAALYGDIGSNTLLNIKKAVPEMNLKSLNELGLSSIGGCALLSDKKISAPKGAYGKLGEASKGKDTTVGHWEIAGLVVETPLPTYPGGFPQDLISEFERRSGRRVIGNKAASGTEIIKELGEEHVKTGALIVYTSADSVFQIAAHEEVVPVPKLYEICQIARDMLVGEHNVSRVIARPFIGEAGGYKRTANRKDFSLKPIGKTMLDYIKDAGLTVAGVGKIIDIFAGIGITQSVHIDNNMDGVDRTLEYMESVNNGLIFTNLVDFDMVYGHRNNAKGYAGALMDFDGRVPEILNALRPEDMLIITADHGCDPTTESTDHSREYIPLIVYGERFKAGVDLRIRNSFADIGATVLEYLSVEGKICGESFLNNIL